MISTILVLCVTMTNNAKSIKDLRVMRCSNLRKCVQTETMTYRSERGASVARRMPPEGGRDVCIYCVVRTVSAAALRGSLFAAGSARASDTMFSGSQSIGRQ